MATKDHISVYIHWPFCKSKCPYCDFNSHVRDSINNELWEQAYLKELEQYADLLSNKRIASIFFGGGTPSLADPRIFDSILNKLSKMASLEAGTEITLEANPTSVEAEKFKAFNQIGINRVSIGIQSLNEESLKFLGREHNVKEALYAIELADKNFPRYSFDLIYTLPDQKIDDWLADLDYAISLAGGHLSLYQLTIEKGTQFYKNFKAQAFTMPDDDLSADFYTKTTEYLASRGYARYEVSNYAMKGNECVHNKTYWRYRDFIGIGPGAHGRYRKDGAIHATVKLHSPESWLKAVAEKSIGLQKSEILTSDQVAKEKLIMGMRLQEGIELDTIPKKAQIKLLIEHGLVEVKDDRLMATDSGYLVLNSVIEALV